MALEDTVFILLYWTGPVGVAFFLAGLGYLIKSIAQAARYGREDKQTRE